MRYLGNKESILDKIRALMEEKNLIGNGYTLCDAFCGSGSVADYFKGDFDLVINDNLNWSVIYTKGRICAPSCAFERLGFDPFEFFNSNDNRLEGFMYNTYSPGGSKRMYFTAENAGRIDYFRATIEEWKEHELINDEEYAYLLACLIESVSDVSNTAGVYGAFLKKWDSRATKPIVFDRVDFNQAQANHVTTFNDKIENVIADIDCDVLYLDPPYTQNQYGTQYHLLETLILDDNPSVSAITGSRPTAPMRSDWSKEYKVNIMFDRVLAKTNARYVIFSYNNDGFMSKDYIEAALKRYGRPETYCFKKISYKKYQNWKSQNQNEHFEYLFFVEMKDKADVVIESPLNYIGSKAKLIPQIKDTLPDNITEFIDIFGGGFNVGINMDCDEIHYNDLNCMVAKLMRSFREIDTYQYLSYVKKLIAKYGLEKGKEEPYYELREYYNSLPKDKRDSRVLYTLILYGYQQQIRFNSKHEFNNPIGVRWFNDKVLEKFISFSRTIKEKDIVFHCGDYCELDTVNDDSFVYLDPPYKLTTGSYNDGKRGFKGWDDNLETEMFEYLNGLNERNIRFMLSYVIEHKGKINNNLLDWVDENGYRIVDLGEVIGISGSKRKEVLIINYEL